LCAVLGGLPGPAGAAELKAGLQGLFDAGWQKTFKAREDADQRYERLKAQAPGDARVDYAYLLVLLRQSRHSEAAKVADGILAQDKKNLAVWQIKAWLAALLKEYNASLSDLPRVAELLPDQEASGEAERPYRDAASLLGRLCGFMEGPVKDAVDDETLARARQRVADRLTTTRREVFEQGRRAVVAQFTGAAEEVEQDAAIAEAEAAKKKAERIEQAGRNAEEAAARAGEIESQVQKAKAELDSELARIAASETALAPQFARVEAEAARVRHEIAILDARIADLLAQADRERDENRRRWLLNDASRWRFERDRWVGSLAGLDRQYAGLNGERLALQQRRAAAEVRYRREEARGDQARKLVTSARGALNTAQNATVTGNTPGVRDQKRRAAALTSYVALPIALDAERDRLLESIP
jgi:predicted  nucleic acid-binding Zn-ribbon protein